MDLGYGAALVTGGGRRIGRAIALGLAREGLAVAVHYHRSAEAAAEAVAEIEGRGGRSVAVPGDLTERGIAERVLAEASAALGTVRVLINNASTFLPSGAGELGTEQLRGEMALHLEAPYRLAIEMARRLPAEECGRIVNLLDWRASHPDPRHFGYSLSKGALLGLTRALAAALGPRITVNGIAPGAILPPAGGGKGSGDYARDLPLAAVGRVEDIVRACVFLVRDADYTTGAVIPVDGGKHLL